MCGFLAPPMPLLLLFQLPLHAIITWKPKCVDQLETACLIFTSKRWNDCNLNASQSFLIFIIYSFYFFNFHELVLGVPKAESKVIQLLLGLQWKRHTKSGYVAMSRPKNSGLSSPPTNMVHQLHLYSAFQAIPQSTLQKPLIHPFTHKNIHTPHNMMIKLFSIEQ